MNDDDDRGTPVVRRREDDDDDDGDNHQMELLMRHSSPLVLPNRAASSPLTERNSSPSPLRLNRPRSNPRNRTPMRYQSPLQQQQPFGGIPEEEDEPRRITIRPTAGRTVGTILADRRDRDERRPVVAPRSRKQGPSHRKVRRWNNDNFVNLAAEIGSGNGRAAAKALLEGQADAAGFLEIVDDPHRPSAGMRKLREDESLRGIRDRFFAGELSAKPPPEKPAASVVAAPAAPERMLHRIDARLRRVVVRACENSVPASGVAQRFEAFLVRAHRGKKTGDNNDDEPAWWEGVLLEPPSVTHRKRDDTYLTRFLFDGDSPNGGFHRLLLHGVCQFHGLKAISSTMEVAIGGKTVQARQLMATGTMAETSKKTKLVDYIMARKEGQPAPSEGRELQAGMVDTVQKLQTLKV